MTTFARKDLTPVRTHPQLGLPCFAGEAQSS
jgi:hypothetical protein